MKSLTLILLGLLCVAPPGHAVDKSGTSVLPRDVVEFKERRDLCDHFRGEDAYNEERGKFLAEGMKKSCTGTDKELASLKSKYSNNEAVIKALADYEEKIEWGN
jgi:hypothetical protein